jgi:acetyl-CoA carboxylase biotin carboxyl carrier protein
MGLLDRILNIMHDSDIVEIEVGNWFRHVKVKRAGAVSPFATVSAPTLSVTNPMPAQIPAETTPTKEIAAPVDENIVIVTAPMVGTFYKAPAPDAPPFVIEGGTVNKGQVLCIIETMKLMNEIESDYSGTIIKVHAENAKPVQFGDDLFSIRKA